MLTWHDRRPPRFSCRASRASPGRSGCHAAEAGKRAEDGQRPEGRDAQGRAGWSYLRLTHPWDVRRGGGHRRGTWLIPDYKLEMGSRRRNTQKTALLTPIRNKERN